MPDSADIVIRGGGAGQWSATQVADFNGDTIDDLLVTQDLSVPEMYERSGSSYIIFGRRQWPATLELPGAADVTLRLDWSTEARMRGCLKDGRRSDLNGDGIPDVLLGAYEYTVEDAHAAGSLFVLFGRRQWPKELEVTADADLTIAGSQSGVGLGARCAVGDVDSDGLSELAVFATEGTLWHLLGERGSTYLFSGRDGWPSRLSADSDATLQVTTDSNSSFHISLLLADVNGDGRDDVIMGRPGYVDIPSAPGRGIV